MLIDGLCALGGDVAAASAVADVKAAAAAAVAFSCFVYFFFLCFDWARVKCCAVPLPNS